jgi:SAM-dependent methyltransferase
MGMLRAAAHPALLNADLTALPLRDGAVDVALAVHMLYHVPDREAAIRELRRVVAVGGTCVAVTNGSRHTRSLRDLIERAVRRETPGWRMRPVTHTFTADNAAAQLSAVFESVTRIRPARTSPAAPGEMSPRTSASKSRRSSTPRAPSPPPATSRHSSAADPARGFRNAWLSWMSASAAAGMVRRPLRYSQPAVDFRRQPDKPRP